MTISEIHCAAYRQARDLILVLTWRSDVDFLWLSVVFRIVKLGESQFPIFRKSSFWNFVKMIFMLSSEISAVCAVVSASRWKITWYSHSAVKNSQAWLFTKWFCENFAQNMTNCKQKWSSAHIENLWKVASHFFVVTGLP